MSLDPRRATGVHLVSAYRPGRRPLDVVVAGAFTDRDVAERRLARAGFRVRWDRAARTVTMRLPSRCPQGGDHGAVRGAVLTERGGGDADWAPADGPDDLVSSVWIAPGLR